MIYGTVTSVEARNLGSHLTADHASGSSTLTVDFATDFSEDGGTLLLGTEELAFTTSDQDANTVTLSGTTGADAYTDDPVFVVEAGEVAVEWLAHVSIDDDDNVTAVIHTTLIPYFTEGVYEDPVWVALGLNAQGAYVVASLPDRTPQFDGGAILPDTLPPDAFTTDGLPPASSPTPTVVAGIGSLFVQWTGVTNADPVTYEVHLDTTSDAPTAGDTDTLAVETVGSVATLRRLPLDDTALLYDTTYYVSIIAKDADDAAAPSARVSGTPVQVTGPDVAAETITGNNIVGNTITGDKMAAQVVLSSEFITGTQGQRVRISSEGITVFAPDDSVMVDLPAVQYDPADPDVTRPATLKGLAELESVTTPALTITGEDSQVANEGVLELAAGVQASTSAPALTATYDTEAYRTSALGYQQVMGWSRSSVNTQEAYVTRFFNTGYLWVVNGSTHEQYDLTAVSFIPLGIVPHHSGDGWEVLGYRTSDQAMAVRHYRIDRTGTPTLTLEAVSSWNIINPTQRFSVSMGMHEDYPDRFYTAEMKSTGDIDVKSWRQDDPGTGTAYEHISTVTLDAPASWDVGENPYQYIGPVYYGAHDGLAGEQVYSLSFNGKMRHWDYPEATERTNLNFDVQDDTQAIVVPYSQNSTPDLVYDGYVELDRFGASLTNYSDDNAWTVTADREWWGAFAWWNSTSGEHTSLSPFTHIQMVKRARLVMTCPAIPVGSGGTHNPDSVKWFLGKNTSTTPPATTAMYLQTDSDPTDTVCLVDARLFSGTTASSAVPTTTFPSALGGVLRGAGLRLDNDPKVSIAGSGPANLDGLIPPGAMLMWGTSTAPTGWVLCDGTALSRALYPDLFNAIGTTFGTGDGSTTFNVPNFVSRFPLGADGSGSPARALGGHETSPSGGSAPGNGDPTRLDHQHTHNVDVSYSTQSNTTTGGTATRVNNINNSGETVSSEGVGGSGADLKYHPSLAVNFIIKT